MVLSILLLASYSAVPPATATDSASTDGTVVEGYLIRTR